MVSFLAEGCDFPSHEHFDFSVSSIPLVQSNQLRADVVVSDRGSQANNVMSCVGKLLRRVSSTEILFVLVINLSLLTAEDRLIPCFRIR